MTPTLETAEEKHDTILWKWKEGQATAPGNFGDPTDADGFALCAYDESAGEALDALPALDT